MLNSAKRRWSKKYLWYSPQNIFFNDIVLEKYKCTAVSHPLLQAIFHGLNVPSMWFSGSKVPQDSLLDMSNLAPHVQCSHKHCYVAHCGMPLSPDPPCKCPFYPHSATIPTHSISLWQVRLSFRTQKLPNNSKTWPCMQKNLNLKMSKADKLNLQVRSLEPDSWLIPNGLKRNRLHAPRWPLNYLF